MGRRFLSHGSKQGAEITWSKGGVPPTEGVKSGPSLTSENLSHAPDTLRLWSRILGSRSLARRILGEHVRGQAGDPPEIHGDRVPIASHELLT